MINSICIITAVRAWEICIASEQAKKTTQLKLQLGEFWSELSLES